TNRVLNGVSGVIEEWQLKGKGEDRLLIVQGDTTTSFAAALAAYYARLPVGHVEAGLRSFDKFRPYPEEMNRRLTSVIADIHFAPTEEASQNLLREGIGKSAVFVTGNTVIDALLSVVGLTRDRRPESFGFKGIDFSKKIILVTAHRRESFGPPLMGICECLREIARAYADSVELIYPVHLNPEVQQVARRILGKEKNVHLIEPLSYDAFVWLMNRSYFVLTDSGGVQEEAPSLGKPVLVMRDTTERTEGIKAGTARLVGTAKDRIRDNAALLLDNPAEYVKMAQAVNPYGDGRSSERIESILLGMHRLNEKDNNEKDP
ncbi:MAG: UDP-N-acetylglucosamine 2-epimerase (non-hydrolyzing), partial [Thermodesulfovibrionales bacterium]